MSQIKHCLPTALPLPAFLISPTEQHRTKKLIDKGYKDDQGYAVPHVSGKTKLGQVAHKFSIYFLQFLTKDTQ